MAPPCSELGRRPGKQDADAPGRQILSVCCILTVCLVFLCSSWEYRPVYSHMKVSEEAHACLPLPNSHSRWALRQGLPLGNMWIREIVLILPNLCAPWCIWAQPLPLLPGTQPAFSSLVPPGPAGPPSFVHCGCRCCCSSLCCVPAACCPFPSSARYSAASCP